MCNFLKDRIEALWNGDSDDISCVHEAMGKMDAGELRIVDKVGGDFVVNDYLKKAILLYFKNTDSQVLDGGLCSYFDKVPQKTHGWSKDDFLKAGFRAVPGCFIRYSAFVARSVVVMPAFINVGAYVDEGTMVDTNALVGSCAQVGKRCHISDGVTIGGSLEPLQNCPVIVEDDCFIGAKSSIVEGVIVGEGAVVAAGTNVTASTRIIDKNTDQITFGKIPPYSVVVPGVYSYGNIGLSCAVIVKTVDEKTRKKTSINELLR